jgi:hypothetical protein
MNQEPKTKSSRGLGLALADGQRWVIRAADEETGECVERLAQAMQLRAADEGREVLVAVSHSVSVHLDDIFSAGPLLCYVPPRLNPILGVIQMEQVARRMALSTLKQGGLLIHGALAEYSGSGFIMAGQGTVGKSTASRRLPAPWRSLSDDRTLVVRDEKGQYWAHPWPTWSLFHDDGPGGSWAVEQAVPLRAIFFLGRSSSDRLESVNATQAAALTIESAMDLAFEASRLPDVNAARTLIGEGVSAAKAMARTVPAYSLKLSLDGRFWEEIERVLPVGPSLPNPARDLHPPEPQTSTAKTPRHEVAGTGPSDRLLPASLQPSIVRFDARGRVFLKLLSGGQTVGEYDIWLERWHIQPYFGRFVDEKILPDPKHEAQSP